MTGMLEHGDNFFIARVNKQDGEKTFLHYSRTRDIFIIAYGFEEATRYDSFEAANRLVKAHNQLSETAESNYQYFVCKLQTKCIELDEEGKEFNHKDLIKGDEE